MSNKCGTGPLGQDFNRDRGACGCSGPVNQGCGGRPSVGGVGRGRRGDCCDFGIGLLLGVGLGCGCGRRRPGRGPGRGC